jgi:uncharacterized protein (DUF433 family)
LPKIRTAIEWLKLTHPVPRPLLSHDFFTDDVNIFVKKLLGKKIRTVNASLGGQLTIEEIVNPLLTRVERDLDGQVFKLFPFTTEGRTGKLISIVHNLSSGRPIVDSVGVRASVIWNRHKAGERVSELAEDYEITEDEARAAIDYINTIQGRQRTVAA